MIFGGPYAPERALALAGCMQALVWVDQVATHGEIQDSTGTLDDNLSLFLCQDPDETAAAMSQVLKFQTGLRILARLSSQLDTDTQRQLGYLIQLVQVARQFAKQPEMMRRVAEEIPHITAATSDRAGRLQAIGELYEATISNLSTRIQIQGSQGYLRQPHVATQIRALLFLGIRFALLWQQQGGKRTDFLFGRNQIAQKSSELLRSVTH